MATEAQGGHYRIENGKKVLVYRTEAPPPKTAAPKPKPKAKPKSKTQE